MPRYPAVCIIGLLSVLAAPAASAATTDEAANAPSLARDPRLGPIGEEKPAAEFSDFTVKPKVQPNPRVDMPLPRGELLYENHCQGCHQSTVHIRRIRRNRRATSPEALRARVQHWSEQPRLNWNSDDVDDVARYLDRRYYKFPPGKK